MSHPTLLEIRPGGATRQASHLTVSPRRGLKQVLAFANAFSSNQYSQIAVMSGQPGCISAAKKDASILSFEARSWANAAIRKFALRVISLSAVPLLLTLTHTQQMDVTMSLKNCSRPTMQGCLFINVVLPLPNEPVTISTGSATGAAPAKIWFLIPCGSAITARYMQSTALVHYTRTGTSPSGSQGSVPEMHKNLHGSQPLRLTLRAAAAAAARACGDPDCHLRFQGRTPWAWPTAC